MMGTELRRIMSEHIKEIDKQIETVRKYQTKVTELKKATTELEIH